jgi:hypothetical protein
MLRGECHHLRRSREAPVDIRRIPCFQVLIVCVCTVFFFIHTRKFTLQCCRCGAFTCLWGMFSFLERGRGGEHFCRRWLPFYAVHAWCVLVDESVYAHIPVCVCVCVCVRAQNLGMGVYIKLEA